MTSGVLNASEIAARIASRTELRESVRLRSPLDIFSMDISNSLEKGLKTMFNRKFGLNFVFGVNLFYELDSRIIFKTHWQKSFTPRLGLHLWTCFVKETKFYGLGIM